MQIQKDSLLWPKAKTSVLEIFQSSKLAIGFFWETEILEPSWVERCKPGSKFSGMQLAL